MTRLRTIALLGILGVMGVGCSSLEGLAEAQDAETTVKFDFDHRPLPEIPLPNDLATRSDESSPTGLRVNISMIAPTQMERNVRMLADGLDGFGVYQQITIPFTDEIDVFSLLEGHRDPDYDTSNDVIYLINITPDSDEYGKLHHLDVGNGNYPVGLEAFDKYGDNDPKEWSLSLIIDETDEDRNDNGELDDGEDENRNGILDPGEDKDGNGVLDLPEDIDADGILDTANYLPGEAPARDDLAGRADALMSFYEKASNTVIVGPMVPLLERTTYAVVVTRRLKDIDGNPVGSPFRWINHTSQTDKLEPLLDVLPDGIDVDDIAFTYAYTTESIQQPWIAVREGLYGYGAQRHLGKEFPAKVKTLIELKDNEGFQTFLGKNPYLLHHEDWHPFLGIVLDAVGGADTASEQYASLTDSLAYIDYHAMGVIESPQLFDRVDDEGNKLALDLQSWPPDLDVIPAEARAEDITFWTTIPRKEVSVRGQNQMAPLVIIGHGYGSNRLTELVGFSGFMAQHGIAAISIDNVSHGIPIAVDQLDMFDGLLNGAGLGGVLDGVLRGRAEDLDGDGVVDSGVDFWTSYLFHLRDMVRQSALDYMQLIRIIRSWDGKKLWEWDVNVDGIANDLAGDFDGDGFVDIGSESPIYVFGGSLGGIMSMTLGAIEPAVDAIVPIAGGGRLGDVGLRSLQGGVPAAVFHRAMGPFFPVTLHDDGTATVATQVVELNDSPTIHVTNLVPTGAEPTLANDIPDTAVFPGDTIVGVNLDNGERNCGYMMRDDVPDDGVAARGRVAIPSDKGDLLEIRFYRGPALVLGTADCEVIEDAEPYVVVDRLQQADPSPQTECTVEGIVCPTGYLCPEEDETNVGQPRFCELKKLENEAIPTGELRALADGLAFHRTSANLRRFFTIAQIIIDPGDPGTLARHFAQSPIVYPRTGEETGTGFMIVTTNGDMNVPAHGGLTAGRAAGVIDYLNIDPDYADPVTGEPKTINQVLIDTHVAEAVNTYKRYLYNGSIPEDLIDTMACLGIDETRGVGLDVENFSGGNDIWEDGVPRLGTAAHPREPLNLMVTEDIFGNDLGGYSGAIFPYAIPEGQHGFAIPGQMTDCAIELCVEKGNPLGQCREDLIGKTYDVGWNMFHALGAWLRSDRQDWPFNPNCNVKESCNEIPPRPALRDQALLP